MPMTSLRTFIFTTAKYVYAKISRQTKNLGIRPFMLKSKTVAMMQRLIMAMWRILFILFSFGDILSIIRCNTIDKLI